MTSRLRSGRFHIELSLDKLRHLEELMEVTSLPTKRELVSNALTLLSWAIRETRAGRRIVSIDARKQQREVILPVLESLKKEADQEVIEDLFKKASNDSTTNPGEKQNVE